MRASLGVLLDNLTSYSGSGLLFLLLLVSVIFLFFKEKDKTKRIMLVAFPVLIFAIALCPAWAIYAALRDDAVILYRIFWVVPSVVIIGYAMIEVISMLPAKMRAFSFAGAVAVIIISGKYIYANPFFSKAENVYHLPETVIEICDEIEVPGREVRACFPDELIQYVRQYTAVVLLPYGRGSFMSSSRIINNDLEYEMSRKIVNTKKLTEELRKTDTHYLIVASDKQFDDSLWKYEFCYVTSIGGYDIYLDNLAYLGLETVNHR